MTDHTDDVTDGLLCECCGQPFDDACGYPRMCADCADAEEYGPETGGDA